MTNIDIPLGQEALDSRTAIDLHVWLSMHIRKHRRIKYIAMNKKVRDAFNEQEKRTGLKGCITQENEVNGIPIHIDEDLPGNLIRLERK